MLAPIRSSGHPAAAPPDRSGRNPDGTEATGTPAPDAGNHLQTLMRLSSADAPAHTLFLTPFGQALLPGLDAFMALPALQKPADLTPLVDRAVARLLRRPGPAVLLLGSGHHVSSSLSLFHAAADACRKYTLPMFIEHSTTSLRPLRKFHRALLQDPLLTRVLGNTTAWSRAGQAVVWHYVRNSGYRGPLQKILPEVLAGFEMAHGGLRLHPVDPQDRATLGQEARDAVMTQAIHDQLGATGKGVFVGGIGHLGSMHVLLRAFGLEVRGVGVLDETSNCFNRLHDCDPDELYLAYGAAADLAYNRQLPDQAEATRQSSLYRVGFDQSPFG